MWPYNKPKGRGKRHALSLLLLLLMVMPALAADMIPRPLKISYGRGVYVLSEISGYRSDTPLARKALAYLESHLGYRLHTVSHKGRGTLSFHYAPEKVREKEGYRLKVSPRTVTIEARDAAGFFYGVVSLMQLADPEIWRYGTGKKRRWHIPVCQIEDAPRYHWRGIMLDSARHFFSTAYIKKFIDRMAQYKLNRFHWHLTDDEGWRIEIERYPLLTKVGAKRGPGTRLPFSLFPAMRGEKKRVEEGYYSQKEIREIVAYAKARCIEILPEIDMPGHAKAAVMAYPEVLQDPQDRSRYRSMQKIENNTIDPGKESSYLFLEGVIAEVSRLFPFAYIHLGGDEVPRGAWRRSPSVQRLMREKRLKDREAVKNYFFARMDAILAKYGKKMVAWQEVLSGKPNVRENDIFMAWKSRKSGMEMMRRGYNTLMAPVAYLYFDQQYVRRKNEPGHTWSTPVSMRKVYRFNPGNSRYLKGVHACLWSETIPYEKVADYLAWPRVLALSEVAWTAERRRRWKEFRHALCHGGLKRLQVQKIYYRDRYCH